VCSSDLAVLDIGGDLPLEVDEQGDRSQDRMEDDRRGNGAHEELGGQREDRVEHGADGTKTGVCGPGGGHEKTGTHGAGFGEKQVCRGLRAGTEEEKG